MPRRMPESTKRKAVADWKSGKRSAKQICSELQITTGLLSKWGQRFEKAMREEKAEEHKEPAPPVAAPEPATENTLPVVRQGRADDETKARAVAEFAKKEKSAKELAEEFGVRDVTIYAWVKAAKKKGAAPSSDRSMLQTAASTDPRKMFKQSVASMDISRMFLDKAVGRIHMLSCPACGHRFRADPPGLTECLITIAAHVAAGEEI